MENLNKLLLRQAQKYLGGLDKVPEDYHAFLQAINESYNHYEKDHRLLERSIELSSTEMIELNEQLQKETIELKKAHEEYEKFRQNVLTQPTKVELDFIEAEKELKQIESLKKKQEKKK